MPVVASGEWNSVFSQKRYFSVSPFIYFVLNHVLVTFVEK